MTDEQALRNARILVVDDEPMNVLLLERILEDAGYSNVRSTINPLQVLPLYFQFQPDLLLLDLHMPHLDGVAVMQQLKPWVAQSGVYLPVVVLTADATVGAKQRALSMGAKDFLTKPIDPTEVLLRIRNLLETRFLHLELEREKLALEDEVRSQTAGHVAARMEAERRAEILSIVARSARAMSSLDSRDVIDVVVDSAACLGFEACAVFAVDDEAPGMVVENGRGLPEAWTKGGARLAVPAMAHRTHGTVVMNDYSSHPMAIPALREAGFAAVATAPVWSEDKLAALLFAATRRAEPLPREEIEALELLAAQASIALGNARRFEEERRSRQRLAALEQLAGDLLSTMSQGVQAPLTAVGGIEETPDNR